jgi:hypothetical protein
MDVERRHPEILSEKLTGAVDSQSGHNNSLEPLSDQVIHLFILAIPVASVAWTVTHEEVFREPREWCANQSQACRALFARKFFYLFTCEYCFSHYVSAIFLAITRFRLLFPDWRGYLISLFALVWVCNFYISIYNRLRLNIKHEHIAINEKQREVARTENNRKAA